MPDQQAPRTALPEPLADLSGDELETLAQLARQQNAAQQPAEPSQPSGPSLGRRGLMAGGGLLSLLAMAGPASAAVDPADGDADLGNGSGPWDVWADGLAMVTEDVSTSTTVTKPIVRYDSALGSLTLQIDSSLEGPSGFSQPMWFLDQTGNADTNPVTVQNSSGATIATIPAQNSIFCPVWDGSEWLTDRFIPTVDAGLVKTPEVQDGSGNTVLGQRVASGATVLTSGSATIDTGVSQSETATFYVALGPDTDDAVVAAEIRAASAGNYEVDIEETETSVGNPTIRYDIVRVR